MKPIKASQAKYIKLGEGRKWQDLCIDDGTARLAYFEVPHEPGLAENREAIRQVYLDRELIKQAASSRARQVAP